VDTFSRLDESDPRYARLVPVEEVADPKNDYNLNQPRYIDSSDPEDLQDIDGHLRGGIPERDLDALGAYWSAMPGLRAALFQSSNRSGYADLKLPITDLKATIFSHPEFTAFTTEAQQLFADWRAATVPLLKGLELSGHPKPLIETIAEELLAAFNAAPLLDAYDAIEFASQQQRPSARTMSHNDMWIAATAKVARATLLTTDKDFTHLSPNHCRVVLIDPKALRNQNDAAVSRAL
jgi:type I restriction enzyme M protein